LHDRPKHDKQDFCNHAPHLKERGPFYFSNQDVGADSDRNTTAAIRRSH
jgi:hypothetical protein